MKALLLKFGAMLVGLLGIIWQSRSAGKHKEKSKQAEKSLKKTKRAKKIQQDIKRSSNDNIRRGLRKHRRKR